MQDFRTLDHLEQQVALMEGTIESLTTVAQESSRENSALQNALQTAKDEILLLLAKQSELTQMANPKGENDNPNRLERKHSSFEPSHAQNNDDIPKRRWRPDLTDGTGGEDEESKDTFPTSNFVDNEENEHGDDLTDNDAIHNDRDVKVSASTLSTTNKKTIAGKNKNTPSTSFSAAKPSRMHARGVGDGGGVGVAKTPTSSSAFSRRATATTFGAAPDHNAQFSRNHSAFPAPSHAGHVTGNGPRAAAYKSPYRRSALMTAPAAVLVAHAAANNNNASSNRALSPQRGGGAGSVSQGFRTKAAEGSGSSAPGGPLAITNSVTWTVPANPQSNAAVGVLGAGAASGGGVGSGGSKGLAGRGHIPPPPSTLAKARGSNGGEGTAGALSSSNKFTEEGLTQGRGSGDMDLHHIATGAGMNFITNTVVTTRFRRMYDFEKLEPRLKDHMLNLELENKQLKKEVQALSSELRTKERASDRQRVLFEKRIETMKEATEKQSNYALQLAAELRATKEELREALQVLQRERVLAAQQQQQFASVVGAAAGGQPIIGSASYAYQPSSHTALFGQGGLLAEGSINGGVRMGSPSKYQRTLSTASNSPQRRRASYTSYSFNANNSSSNNLIITGGGGGNKNQTAIGKSNGQQSLHSRNGDEQDDFESEEEEIYLHDREERNDPINSSGSTNTGSPAGAGSLQRPTVARCTAFKSVVDENKHTTDDTSTETVNDDCVEQKNTSTDKLASCEDELRGDNRESLLMLNSTLKCGAVLAEAEAASDANQEEEAGQFTALEDDENSHENDNSDAESHRAHAMVPAGSSSCTKVTKDNAETLGEEDVEPIPSGSSSSQQASNGYSPNARNPPQTAHVFSSSSAASPNPAAPAAHPNPALDETNDGAADQCYNKEGLEGTHYQKDQRNLNGEGVGGNDYHGEHDTENEELRLLSEKRADEEGDDGALETHTDAQAVTPITTPIHELMEEY